MQDLNFFNVTTSDDPVLPDWMWGEFWKMPKTQTNLNIAFPKSGQNPVVAVQELLQNDDTVTVIVGCLTVIESQSSIIGICVWRFCKIAILGGELRPPTMCWPALWQLQGEWWVGWQHSHGFTILDNVRRYWAIAGFSPTVGWRCLFLFHATVRQVGVLLGHRRVKGQGTNRCLKVCLDQKKGRAWNRGKGIDGIDQLFHLLRWPTSWFLTRETAPRLTSSQCLSQCSCRILTMTLDLFGTEVNETAQDPPNADDKEPYSRILDS